MPRGQSRIPHQQPARNHRTSSLWVAASSWAQAPQQVHRNSGRSINTSLISNSSLLLSKHTRTGTEQPRVFQLSGSWLRFLQSSRRITIQSCDSDSPLPSLELYNRVFHPQRHKLVLTSTVQVFLWPSKSTSSASASSFPCWR